MLYYEGIGWNLYSEYSGGKETKFMKLEFRQMVMCNHVAFAQVCKTMEWELPVPRAGEYIAGLEFLNGAEELLVQKVLHQVESGMCCIELPAFDTTQLRISYKELEYKALRNDWTLQKV